MQEVFDFAQCADPERSILWNIESKIDPRAPEKTKGVREFVERQHKLFEKSGYKGSIVVSPAYLYGSIGIIADFVTVPEL